MDYAIYKNSLGLALTLMLFFACYFFIGKTPDKPIYRNYKRSRRYMGMALLLLSANYSVHLFVGLRFLSQEAAILMNLCTYFMSYWLFSAALITLLDRFYVTRRRFMKYIAGWLGMVALAFVILFSITNRVVSHAGIIAMAVVLFAVGIHLARRIIMTYHQAVRIFDDTHSENIAAYIRWMSIFTWWAVIYGVSCGILTFLPDEYVFLWILSSVPFYIYLFHSYMNYLLFYEQVETILEKSPAEEPPKTDPSVDTPVYFSVIEKNMKEWLGSDGYTTPGLTIEDLAVRLGTNRTYLSAYIKQTFGMSFREWIANHRIEYAKRMFTSNPQLTVGEVCEATGFISQSYFVKIFAEKEGMSPSKWKKQK